MQFSNNLSLTVTLKWGQGHQNLISPFQCLNNIVVQVCSNPFIHSGDRVHTNHFPTNLSPHLENGVKVNKI